MKVLIFLLLAVYSVNSLTFTKQILAEKFESFKTSFKKTYVNTREETFRQQIFQSKLQHIEEHNEKFEKGSVTYKLGINQFTDMTEEEVKAYTQGLIKPASLPKPVKEITNRTFSATLKIPDSFDWRTHGIVTKVKDQGGCGSCWAFSATGALEAHYKLAYGARREASLSEQQLVDCMYDDGCEGGWPATVFEYILSNGGIDNDEVYPYEARGGGLCRYRKEQVSARVNGYASLSDEDETKMAQMLYSFGPLSVAIDADGDFGGYSSGVYYNPDCEQYKFTHAVVVVGYGTENGQDYWLVKNSWGTWWGDNGYLKMARNRGNNCNIASAAIYPIL